MAALRMPDAPARSGGVEAGDDAEHERGTESTGRLLPPASPEETQQHLITEARLDAQRASRGVRCKGDGSMLRPAALVDAPP